MTWNYRIVRYADGRGYGLHEVYYDAVGEPASMTASPAAFVSEDVTEIHEAMMMARQDAIRRPIFDEPPGWVEVDDE